MFEHSRALHAHNQQRRQQNHVAASMGNASSLQETSYNPLTSRQHGSISTTVRQSNGGAGAGITHNQLSSALAGALGSTSSSSASTPWFNSSPVASLNQPPAHSASTNSSGMIPPTPNSTPLQRFSTSNSESDGAGDGSRPGPINAASLQQALANVAGSTMPAGAQVQHVQQEISCTNIISDHNIQWNL